ncbi:MAG: serine--tRNA ligase, partial [Raoultibacter sp.]
MLDIRFVRDNQEVVAAAMKNRNASWDAELFSKHDEARRAAIAAEESLQAERNTASKAIGQMMAAGKKDEAEVAKEQVRTINEKIAAFAAEREEAESVLNNLLLSTPNLPADSTPIGADENDNPEIRRWGTPPAFDFNFKPHWDLGTELGIIDFERAVKLAKSRVILLGGLGARLVRYIIKIIAETHSGRGYKE